MRFCTDSAQLAVCPPDVIDGVQPSASRGCKEMGTDRMSAVLLNTSGTAPNSVRNVGRILEPLLDVLEQLFSARRIVTSLRNGCADRLVMLASRGFADDWLLLPNSHEWMLSMSILDSGEMISIPDISEDPLLDEYPVGGRPQERRGSFVGAPILSLGVPAGALCVYFLSEAGRALEERSNFVNKVAVLLGHMLDVNHRAVRREQALVTANNALKAEIRGKIANFLTHHRNRHVGQAIRLVREAAGAEVPLLIQGEVGTGRTLAAQAIHELSDRHERPFVRIDCRVHGHELHEVLARRYGGQAGEPEPRVEPSDSSCCGSLFLSGIETLSMASQNVLVRILSQSRPDMTGIAGLTPCGARVIAASATNLSRAVQSGSFSAELFQMLTTIVIEIPPLRDRREDLSSLIGFFAERASNGSGHPLKLTPRAMRLLHRHSWPGNVRELENLIERMTFTAGDREIDVDDLSLYTAASSSRFGRSENDGLDALQLLEKRSVVSALERHNWVQSRAARELGITMRQMGYRIQKYHLLNLVKQNRGSRRNRE